MAQPYTSLEDLKPVIAREFHEYLAAFLEKRRKIDRVSTALLQTHSKGDQVFYYDCNDRAKQFPIAMCSSRRGVYLISTAMPLELI